MAEQRPLTEQEFNALVNRVIESAPAGLDEATFTAMLDNEVAKAEQAVAAQSQDFSQYGPMQDLLKNQANRESLRSETKENLPGLAAMAATAAVPALGAYTIPARLAAAGGSAYLGARARGDERGDATVEGIKHAGIQSGGELLTGLSRSLAPWFMKGAVPEPIAAKFPEVDLPKEMLDRGVFPGFPASARRVRSLSKAANAERHAAAETVPAMPRRRLIAELKPLHAEATLAKEPEIAADMLEYMRTAARNVGPEGLTGPAALAKKTVKQRTGKAALKAGNSKEAAVIPQMAEAERRAITSHFRETPRMATALDESQALMAIDKVMRKASRSNLPRRMKLGGIVSGVLTAPSGQGVTAHAVNQGARVFDPQVLRALEILMRSRSGESPRRRQP